MLKIFLSTKCIKKHISCRDGFTLIEIVIGIGLTAIVVFLVGTIGNQFSVIGNFVNQKLQNRMDAERVFQTMIREIRSAGLSALGAYAIESATPTSFTFFSDIDGDGRYERVRYFLSTSTAATSTVNKGVIRPTGNPLLYPTSTEVVSPAILNSISTSTVFKYFDANSTGTQGPLPSPVDAPKITVVKIETWVDVKPGTSSLPTYFTGTAQIRSLKNN